jgi:hypothetical protein
VIWLITTIQLQLEQTRCTSPKKEDVHAHQAIRRHLIIHLWHIIHLYHTVWYLGSAVKAIQSLRSLSINSLRPGLLVAFRPSVIGAGYRGVLCPLWSIFHLDNANVVRLSVLGWHRPCRKSGGLQARNEGLYQKTLPPWFSSRCLPRVDWRRSLHLNVYSPELTVPSSCPTCLVPVLPHIVLLLLWLWCRRNSVQTI